jgi:hypothetical protein
MLYNDVAERPITDVDVRIRPRDFWRWRKVAREWDAPCWSVVWSARSRAYDFAPLSLDLEASVGPPGLCALTVATMLSRAVPFEIAADVRVLVPELHDHAVVLVVNAFKDRFVGGNPASLVDLERIVALRDFRCDTFVELAFLSQIATLTWIVAGWMEEERASQAWRAVRVAIESREEPRRLYAALYRRIAQSPSASSRPAYLYAMSGGDHPVHRLQTVAGLVASTAERVVRRRIGIRAAG